MLGQVGTVSVHRDWVIQDLKFLSQCGGTSSRLGRSISETNPRVDGTVKKQTSFEFFAHWRGRGRERGRQRERERERERERVREKETDRDRDRQT